MADVKRYVDIINQCHHADKSDEITFAELIHKMMEGKLIEIYIGDTYEDLRLQDSTTKIASVLCGKVVAAFGECLVMDCAYVDKGTKKVVFGNVVIVNERSIRTLTEVDNRGTLKDTFLSSKEAVLIKEELDKNPQ